MSRRLLGVGLVLVLAWGGPASGAPNKPNKPNKNNNPPPAANDTIDTALLPRGKYVGKLLSVPGSDRLFTVSITYQDVQFNPNVRMPSGNTNNLQRQAQQVQRLQQQAARSASHQHAVHNMAQLQQAIQQMQVQQQRLLQQQMRLARQAQQQQLKLLQQEIQAIQKMYKVVQVTKTFEFQASPEVKVRTKQLPEVFDDQGNVKKYTQQERLKLKGKDRNLPGYESSLESLQEGQLVEVYLAARKAPSKKKDLDKEAGDAAAKPEKKMQAGLIVVLPETQSPGQRVRR